MRSSSFSMRTVAKGPSFGTRTPTTKPPKRAWMPMASVMKPAARTKVRVAQMKDSLTGSPTGERRAAKDRAGRRKMVAPMMKAAVERRTQRVLRGEPEPERAMARARRIQAATSLTAAADMAMRPRSVVRSLSSARMRARTGKAVMESETPMKTRNGPGRTPGLTVERRTKEVPMPRANGREIPATAMARAVRPVRRKARRSNSRPTRKRKKRRPKLASVSRTVRLLVGNTVSSHAMPQHQNSQLSAAMLKFVSIAREFCKSSLSSTCLRVEGKRGRAWEREEEICEGEFVRVFTKVAPSKGSVHLLRASSRIFEGLGGVHFREKKRFSAGFGWKQKEVRFSAGFRRKRKESKVLCLTGLVKRSVCKGFSALLWEQKESHY
ncbi:hypothetical protein M5K25_027617 [Dendrobium thyrsiflorum]|uniref:Uncharacterized protein n=1 Tax=Dendrobium thyrsiflorum TaxID=117978 RepID=A0ABD0TU94_DENTH